YCQFGFLVREIVTAAVTKALDKRAEFDEFVEARKFLYCICQPALAFVEAQMGHARLHEKTRFRQDSRNLERGISGISYGLAVEVAACRHLGARGVREDNFHAHIRRRL